MKIKYSIKKKYKGGGSPTPTTTESIPAWAVPYLQNVGNNAQNMYGSGQLSQVAGTSALQNQAFGAGGQAVAASGGQGLDYLQQQQSRLNNMAVGPDAATVNAQKEAVVLDANKRVAGLNNSFGQAGSLGSARQGVMQGAQNAETVGQLAKVEADAENAMFQNRLAAEGALGGSVGASGSLASNTATTLAGLGNQQRDIAQQQADAGWQGLQRYASTIYGNPARQSANPSGGK